MWRVLALAPHEVPESFAIRLFLVFSFTALRDKCSLYERLQSKATQGRGRASDVEHSVYSVTR